VQAAATESIGKSIGAGITALGQGIGEAMNPENRLRKETARAALAVGLPEKKAQADLAELDERARTARANLDRGIPEKKAERAAAESEAAIAEAGNRKKVADAMAPHVASEALANMAAEKAQRDYETADNIDKLNSIGEVGEAGNAELNDPGPETPDQFSGAGAGGFVPGGGGPLAGQFDDAYRRRGLGGSRSGASRGGHMPWVNDWKNDQDYWDAVRRSAALRNATQGGSSPDGAGASGSSGSPGSYATPASGAASESAGGGNSSGGPGGTGASGS
jgi:hypothetical protein